MIFDEAFHKLLGHEGGYVNHPKDPGGETNWGITIAVAREAGYYGPMRDLPMYVAKEIYRENYWDAVRADLLPEAVRYAVFDAAVNSGVRQSIKWLQQAVGVEADGLFGPKTLAAVESTDSHRLFCRLLSMRLRFFTNLRTWGSFGKGWSRRIADLLGDT